MAYVALAVLAAAALAREACRYVLRACIGVPRACRRVVVRVGAAVEAFAAKPEPTATKAEPTIGDEMQRRLAAAEVHRERQAELWAKLAGSAATVEQALAEQQQRLDRITAEQAAEQAEQARDALIDAALHADAVWRVKTAGLGFEPKFTASARGN